MIIEEKYKEFFKCFTEKTYGHIRYAINNDLNTEVKIKIIEITDYEILKETCDIYDDRFNINACNINNDLFKFKDSYYYFNKAIMNKDYDFEYFYFLKMDEKLANLLLMDVSL